MQAFHEAIGPGVARLDPHVADPELRARLGELRFELTAPVHQHPIAAALTHDLQAHPRMPPSRVIGPPPQSGSLARVLTLGKIGRWPSFLAG